MGDFINNQAAHNPIVIYQDGGGLVTKYQNAAMQYNLERRQVKILGECRSACILALSVKNVCVGPKAVVMAHMAYEKDTGIRRPDVTAQMIDTLPYRVKAHLEGHIEREYTPHTTMNYATLKSLGIKECVKDVYAKDEVSENKNKRLHILNPLNLIGALLRR